MEYLKEFIIITVSGIMVAFFSAAMTKFDIFKVFSKQRKARIKKIQKEKIKKSNFLIWFYKNSKYFFVAFAYYMVLFSTLVIFKSMGYMNFSVFTIFGIPAVVYYFVYMFLCTISSMYFNDLENKIQDDIRD